MVFQRKVRSFHPLFLFVLFCTAGFILSSVLEKSTSGFNFIPTLRSAPKRHVVPITHEIPPPSEDGVCTIFRCANRVLPFMQQFSHPEFRYYFLDESDDVKKFNKWAGWCRVPQLDNLRKAGHKCVVYADDDIFLNLSKVAQVKNSAPSDFLVVGTNENFGNDLNIVSRFLLFTDIQGEFSKSVIKGWRKYFEDPDFDATVAPLHDQPALNLVLNCTNPKLLCYHGDDNSQRLGFAGHCHVNKGSPPNKKQTCMEALKRRVTDFDSDPLF